MSIAVLVDRLEELLGLHIYAHGLAGVRIGLQNYVDISQYRNTTWIYHNTVKQLGSIVHAYKHNLFLACPNIPVDLLLGFSIKTHKILGFMDPRNYSILV